MKRSAETEERKCKVCGVVFNPRKSTQVYCSKRCQKRASNCTRYGHDITPSPVWKPTRCSVCGHMFVPERYNQKYCSRTCYTNAHKEMMRHGTDNQDGRSTKDVEAKIMEYLSLPSDMRLKMLDTLSMSERYLAKKLWMKMHQSETIFNKGGLY